MRKLILIILLTLAYSQECPDGILDTCSDGGYSWLGDFSDCDNSIPNSSETIWDYDVAIGCTDAGISQSGTFLDCDNSIQNTSYGIDITGGIIDECGVCNGALFDYIECYDSQIDWTIYVGNSPYFFWEDSFNCIQDCAGFCHPYTPHAYSVCGGSGTVTPDYDATPVEPYCEPIFPTSYTDCAGVCGGDLEFDCCGVCGGDNSSCDSCCGLPFNDDCTSDCYLDLNGECCLIVDTDCAGICYGNTEIDNCGVCGGDGTSCNTPGDLNGDGIFNVVDIVLLVNAVMDWTYNPLGDLNEDGVNNVVDVVLLVNLVLYETPENCDIELWGECYNIDNTTSLNLSQSGLSGEIPPQIGALINLTYLNLHSNQLTGEIIPEIGDLVNLTYLDLQNNQLTGQIPSEIGNLINLVFLHLNDNNLTGSIPDDICDLTIDWSGIWSPEYYQIPYFNINDNNLCPPYPECLSEEVEQQNTSNCP